jgi:RNA polymerase sigma-70 factor (ECF subfamily)
MDRTPASLLEKLRQPHAQAAWERFIELYSPLLFSWCRRAGLQNHDAADLVQEVFVTLMEVLPTFSYDQHKSFRRWLRTLTLNKWRDGCRRRAWQSPNGEAILAEAVAADDLDAFWETEFRQQLADRALRLMRTDFQESTWKAFWEHAIAGRPALEVAAELGISPGAVYAARFRVLDRLRRELAGMLD